MSSLTLKVAVIGAGAAGLITAHELQKKGHRVVIFEKSDKIGGLWVYDSAGTESDPPPPPPVAVDMNPDRVIVQGGSMYRSLRTNLPRHLMGFSDFAFTDKDYGDPRLFPGHQEVLSFLNDFAEQFGLVELIHFNTEVVRVELQGSIGNGNDLSNWLIGTRKSNDTKLEENEEVFEAVVICNGHHTVPRFAAIPGMMKWPGKQLHSRGYRAPEPFTDKVVVVIGNGPSGYDISRDISKAAKEVHLSSRYHQVSFFKLDFHDNMWQHSMIDSLCEDGMVVFKDGSSVYADIILHCTGYTYEFPFLKTNGIVSVDDNRVDPLYKHVFPPEFAPRLSFIGLPNKILLFDMFELQAKWVVRALSRKIDLPSQKEMMDDIKEEYRQMEDLKRPKHLTHYFYPPIEVKYLNWLAAETRAEPVEKYKIEMYRKLRKCMEQQEDGFRDDQEFQSSLLAETRSSSLR